MIEFYQAYATYHDLMDLTEKLFKGIATDVCGSATIQYRRAKGDTSVGYSVIKVGCMLK
jgi:lysyl-tRNA synthetase class 2